MKDQHVFFEITPNTALLRSRIPFKTQPSISNKIKKHYSGWARWIYESILVTRIDDRWIYQSNQTKTFWYCMMQLQDSSVSPIVFLLKMGPLKDKQKLCVAKNAEPACDLRIFGQPLYLPNQQVRWRFDLEETNALFFKGISMPKSLFCLFVVPPLAKQYGTESETLWQTWDPPKRKTICQKKDMIFDCLGETVTEHIWYEFFEVIDSPNFHLLFPGIILNKRMCFFFSENSIQFNFRKVCGLW